MPHNLSDVKVGGGKVRVQENNGLLSVFLAEFVRRYTSRAVDYIYSASSKALLRLYWSPIKTLSHNTRKAVTLGPRRIICFVFNTCFARRVICCVFDTCFHEQSFVLARCGNIH